MGNYAHHEVNRYLGELATGPLVCAVRTDSTSPYSGIGCGNNCHVKQAKHASCGGIRARSAFFCVHMRWNRNGIGVYNGEQEREASQEQRLAGADPFRCASSGRQRGTELR